MDACVFASTSSGSSYASYDTCASKRNSEYTRSRSLLRPHQSSRPSRIRPDSRSGNRHGTSKGRKVLMRSNARKRLNSTGSSLGSHRGNSTSARALRSDVGTKICTLLRAVVGGVRKAKTKEECGCERTRQRRKWEDVKPQDKYRRQKFQQTITTKHTEQVGEKLSERQRQSAWNDFSQSCTRCGDGKVVPDPLYLLSKKYWEGETSRRAQIQSKRRQGIKWLSALCRDSSNWLEGVIGTEESRKMVNVASYVDESNYRISLWGFPADGIVLALPEMRTALLLSTLAIFLLICFAIAVYNAVVLFVHVLIPLFMLSTHSESQ